MQALASSIDPATSFRDSRFPYSSSFRTNIEPHSPAIPSFHVAVGGWEIFAAKSPNPPIHSHSPDECLDQPHLRSHGQAYPEGRLKDKPWADPHPRTGQTPEEQQRMQHRYANSPLDFRSIRTREDFSQCYNELRRFGGRISRRRPHGNSGHACADGFALS